MKKYYILLLLIACTNFAFAQEFYVTTSGTSDKDGRSEEEAWNIEHAFATAKAGETVWIKAGNYGNKNLTISVSGTNSNPIRFIGYNTTPGDISSCFGSTFEYTPGAHPNLNNELDGNTMPLLEGDFSTSNDSNIGLKITGNFVRLENFQVTKYYNINLISSGQYNILKNIVSTQCGSFTNKAYKGKALIVGGDHSELHNSIVINAAAEGITIAGGDEQKHSYNKVYSDHTVNPTDYYYLITLGTSGGVVNPADSNVIEDVYVERVGALDHYGHGICHKVASINNTVSNATIINTNFEHNFAEVYNNKAYNISITGIGKPWNHDEEVKDTEKDHRSSFLFRNGAHDNEIHNSKIVNGLAMAVFADKDDGYPGVGGDLDSLSAGYNNKLFNVIGDSMLYGVDFDRFDLTAGIAQNNGFYNCTFNDVQDLFRVDCPNEGTYFKNCIFNSVISLESTAFNGSFNLDIDDSSFENCNFSNTGFGPVELAITSNAASEINESDVTSGFNVNPAYLSLNSVSASYSGDYAVKSVLNIAGQSKYIWYNFTAEVGSTYEVRFFAKKNVGTNQRITGWQNLNITEGPGSATITNQWEEYVYTAVATSSSAQLRFYVGSGTQAEEDSDFLIDNLTIKEKFGERSSLYDPEFFDEEGGIFRLTGSSKLIDQGVSPSGVVYGDYINTVRPQGDHYDIGAFEYTGNNEAPVALLTSPCNGDRFNTGESIRLEAFASDLDGAISKVEFKRGGGVSMGTITQAPYKKNIQFNSPGTYYITAYAYDNEDVVVQSESVEVIVEACELVYIADNRFEQVLIDQGYDSDGVVNQSICLDDALSINHLDIGAMGSNGTIADLTGMEHFENLASFKAHGANLGNDLDFSENEQLKSISLTVVSVENVNIASNTDLEFIDIRYCYGLAGIMDLSQLTQLQSVRLFDTSLDGLNIRNGVNSNSMSLDVQGSFAAGCIQVDDPVAAAGYGNWHKDSDDQYSADCSLEWSETSIFSPTNDVFLQGSARLDEVTIAAGAGSSRKAYLMFDLSSLDGTITAAELQFTTEVDPGNGVIQVFYGDSNNWTEENITLANAPTENGLIGSIDENYNTGNVSTISINHAQLVNGLNSLVLIQDASGNQMRFASKENTTYDSAKLVISYLPNQGTSLKVALPTNLKTDSEIRLFPNPAKERIMISGVAGTKQITVTDITGRIVYQANTEQPQPIVNLETYPSGLYIVHVKTKVAETSFKLLKE